MIISALRLVVSHPWLTLSLSVIGGIVFVIGGRIFIEFWCESEHLRMIDRYPKAAGFNRKRIS